MTSDFIIIDGNKPPDGAWAEMIDASHGGRLRAAYFPIDKPRGAVIVQTGWSEFIEKYFETVGDLQRRGFSVAMTDWRGQGRSDRASAKNAGWIDYFDWLTDDLADFAENHVATKMAGPYYLLTHSMGGMPALRLLSRGFDLFRRAVLSAPLTRLAPPLQNSLIAAAANAACLLGRTADDIFAKSDDAFAFEGNMFTKDRARHERFRDLQLAGPEAALTTPSYGWVRAVARASAEIHRPGYFAALKTPTLIISAGDERRIDGRDHALIASRSPLIEHAVVDGALHEILMESDPFRDAFWRLFDEFVARDENQPASSASASA